MKTALIRNYLNARRQPLSASLETAPRLELLTHQAPQFCLSALADSTTHVSQRAHLLAGLVRSSIELDQLVGQLHRLSDSDLLTLLDGLRLRRINSRRVRQLILRALVGHNRFAQLAANHRLRLRRVLKHALGERSWSSVRRFLEVASPEGEAFLWSKLLRFAPEVGLPRGNAPEVGLPRGIENGADQAREALCFLAGLGFDSRQAARRSWVIPAWLTPSAPHGFTNETLRQSAAARHDLSAGRGMPRATLSGLRGTYHRQTPSRVVRELAAPVVRRERDDGRLTAALKEALASGEVTSLDALVSQVAGAGLPVVEVQAAIVLDLSASTLSSGERLYHPAALGLALVGLLQQHVSDLNVFQVGGSAILNGRGIPQPQGATDLATAVLQAARTQPEAILIVTDGYENLLEGDVAQVVTGMRRLGLTTVVEQVTPVIAAAEDLARRRLSESVPVVPVEHESGVGELAARLLLAGQGDELDAQALPAVEQLLFAV